MLQLCKFNLQFALGTVCATRKDIQNQADPINDPAVQTALQIALLCRRQFMIEDDDIGFGGHYQGGNFISLAAPHEQCSIRTAAFALYLAQDVEPRTF